MTKSYSQRWESPETSSTSKPQISAAELVLSAAVTAYSRTRGSAGEKTPGRLSATNCR